MLTLKLKIDSSSHNLIDFQQQYSYAFRKMYKNYDRLSSKEFEKLMILKFGLDSEHYRGLSYSIELKRKIIQNQKDKLSQRIVEIEKLINTLLDKRTRFKLMMKKSKLERQLASDIVFGKKSVLQELTRGNSNKKDEWTKARLIPILITGDAYYSGNKKFRIESDTIYYKLPSLKSREWSTLQLSKLKTRQKHLLSKLQKMSEQNKIPLTFQLTPEFVCISYDEEKLNNYHLDDTQIKKEWKSCINSDQKKEVYREHCKDQEQRKLIGKIKNRIIGVDLNPEYIGISIRDKSKTLKSFCIDITKYSKRLKLSSSDPKQKYQNNKRKTELYEIWKYIFKIATHYKCSKFAIEDLNFKHSEINTNSKEANRKTKNIWHLDLQKHCIQKYCNSLGIELVEVNPAYSSFIGNIQYNFFDPVNAALEISRRGLYKFEKGKFYPELTEADLDTMSSLAARDVQDSTIVKFGSWKQAFDSFKQMGYRYRRRLEDCKIFKSFSLNSHRSGILVYEYS